MRKKRDCSLEKLEKENLKREKKKRGNDPIKGVFKRGKWKEFKAGRILKLNCERGK